MSETTLCPIWEYCRESLAAKIKTEEFVTWIDPLECLENDAGLCLYAPNTYVLNQVNQHYLSLIQTLVNAKHPCPVTLKKGSVPRIETKTPTASTQDTLTPSTRPAGLNASFTFAHFVTGDANQLAYAAAKQVCEQPGIAYNPLFIHGDSGLGKTHIMSAIANELLQRDPSTRIAYIHSEHFVSEMVNALQQNKMNAFKAQFRNVDVLCIDDVQFIANKVRTQEEFFHTFNTIMDKKGQIIMTCDCYPKELSGLEDRLKSRFSWGLVVGIEPPDLETRVAILQSKAQQSNKPLDQEVAFFIAKRVRANVRELEGALKRVIASAHFTGQPITLSFAQQALKDLMSAQDKITSIENIQKTVAKYYMLKLADLSSKTRSRHIARPRQVAMYLCKELTDKSLPDIGEAFGGRDHTTVLHAYRRIESLMQEKNEIKEDIALLLRQLNH